MIVSTKPGLVLGFVLDGIRVGEHPRRRGVNCKRPATTPTAIPAAALSYPPFFGGAVGCRANVHGGRITWRHGDRAV